MYPVESKREQTIHSPPRSKTYKFLICDLPQLRNSMYSPRLFRTGWASETHSSRWIGLTHGGNAYHLICSGMRRRGGRSYCWGVKARRLEPVYWTQSSIEPPNNRLRLGGKIITRWLCMWSRWLYFMWCPQITDLHRLRELHGVLNRARSPIRNSR